MKVIPCICLIIGLFFGIAFLIAGGLCYVNESVCSTVSRNISLSLVIFGFSLTGLSLLGLAIFFVIMAGIFKWCAC